MWSTSRRIAALDLGTLTKDERPSEVQTTKTWVDGSGKKKWQGTSDLKGTQSFNCT